MTKKILVALILGGAILTFCPSVWAQQATANANQGQTQGQTAIGGLTNSSAGAISDQTQGQTQFQSGGGATNVLSNVGSPTITFEGSQVPRDLPIPAPIQVDMGGGPANFSQPENNNGAQFMSMQNLVDALNVLDLDAVEVEGDGDIQMNVQELNRLSDEEILTAMAEDYGTLVADAADGSAVIGEGKWRPKFSLNRAGASVMETGELVRPMAIVTLRSDDGEKVNSAMLAAKLAAFAKSIHANKIVFVSEGSVRELSSWGVGIGLNTVQSRVDSDPNGYGSVASGGTGWSWGKSRYLHLPFVTAIVGR